MSMISKLARPLVSKVRPKTPIRSLSQNRSRGGGTSTITKLVVVTAATAGVAYGTHSFRYRNAEPANYRKPILIDNDPPKKSLRKTFNFIDKVVKKCSSSVVYIEIKDPIKMDPETGKPLTTSNGSGFIVRDDGWILTNAHVIINRPGSVVMVMMQDGSAYEAKVVDADMNIDLALLKVKCDRKLPYLDLGNSSDVSTGEWVVALGSPLSLSHSVTAGVVSSVDRGAEELGLKNFSMRYIQTDAAITFGNSGGPLVNLEGEVIGINNLRVTAGIAFAIPVDYAKKFLERSNFSLDPKTMSFDYNKKSLLGITTISVTPELIGELQGTHQTVPQYVTHGVLVWKVADKTPAQQSGLVAGDIITHVNGFPVHNVKDIYSFFGHTRVKMDVIHKGKRKEITIKL